MSPLNCISPEVTPIVCLIFCAAVGCHSDSIFGPPTESTCPQDSALSYETFGKPFMERYCTDCHSSELRSESRQGAPSFHDFDTLSGTKAVSDHIDQTTAAGPAATNQGMPPRSPYPSQAEREQLGQWIACGLP